VAFGFFDAKGGQGRAAARSNALFKVDGSFFIIERLIENTPKRIKPI